MTASEQEKVVRTYWKRVESCWSTSISQPTFMVELPVLWCYVLTVGYFKTEEDAWSAAYAYTLDHQQKRAELEEEIGVVSADIAEATLTACSVEVSIRKRTLARLQSLLEQHMRGVRKDAE